LADAAAFIGRQSSRMEGEMVGKNLPKAYENGADLSNLASLFTHNNAVNLVEVFNLNEVRFG
jgi:hypothetical protein